MDKKVLDRLQALCSRKEYCRAEILQKALKDLEGNSDAAEEIVESLVADGFVDDSRYADAFAREKAYISGWGPVKISFQLRSKGVGREEINAAIDDLEEEKMDQRLLRVLEVKAKSLKGDPQRKLKLIKFALSRGYEYDSVSKLLPELEVGE